MHGRLRARGRSHTHVATVKDYTRADRDDLIRRTPVLAGQARTQATDPTP